MQITLSLQTYILEEFTSRKNIEVSKDATAATLSPVGMISGSEVRTEYSSSLSAGQESEI